MGEAKAKAYLREFFSREDNIPYFSLLFSDHIPSFPPDFHIDTYSFFADLKGYKAAAEPRGFAKSTITDLVFLLWVALNAKRRFIILISDTYGQATLLLQSVKQELETNEIIRWLYESPQGTTWSDNDIEINGISSEGEYKSVKVMAKGAGMKIRGLKFLNFRPDLIIFDDLENDEAVSSIDRRRKLRNWLVRAVLPALAPDGAVILIGTVLHRDSLLSNILNRKEEMASWESIFIQAIKDNQSVWPERFSFEDLIRMRDDPTYEHYLGPIAFSQEMMNKPIAEEDQIFQPEWFAKSYKLQELLNNYHAEHAEIESSNVLSEWMRETFTNVPSSVDPAISEKAKADYWAMATVGVTRACPLCEGNPAGHILQLDMERMREKDPINQAQITIDSYKRWKQDKIKVEAVQYQAGLYQLIQRIGSEQGVYPPIRAFRPDRDKRRRGIIFSAIAAGHMFHLREDHPLYRLLFDEFVQFPQGDHDDMIDAIFAACEDVTMKSKLRAFKAKPAGF